MLQNSKLILSLHHHLSAEIQSSSSGSVASYANVLRQASMEIDQEEEQEDLGEIVVPFGEPLEEEQSSSSSSSEEEESSSEEESSLEEEEDPATLPKVGRITLFNGGTPSVWTQWKGRFLNSLMFEGVITNTDFATIPLECDDAVLTSLLLKKNQSAAIVTNIMANRANPISLSANVHRINDERRATAAAATGRGMQQQPLNTENLEMFQIMMDYWNDRFRDLFNYHRITSDALLEFLIAEKQQKVTDNRKRYSASISALGAAMKSSMSTTFCLPTCWGDTLCS